jgi:ammonium transporter, Amt family
MNIRIASLFIISLMQSFPVMAGDNINTADTAWIMTSTALVLFMTLPGLALFYGGLVRSNSVLSILMQCFSITCIASVLWFVLGYSIAFGDGGETNAIWGGLGKMFLLGVTESSLSGALPETVFLMFQMTFAIITPALIIGAFAERMKFLSVCVFSSAWLILVYAPVVHWVWGGGWLADLGVMDFAGGIVVHLTAGIAALIVALVIGTRRGYPNIKPPHNLTMSVTGAGMLWVGWFGFNGGSALAANGDAGMAILATHLSAASGAFVWMLIEWIKYKKASVLGLITGMVAGLGTITPASGFVGPIAAVIIGCSGGFICFYATVFIKQVLQIDDSLDVFPVHGVGGILGSLLVAVFASTNIGVFSGQGFLNNDVSGITEQLGIQMFGIIVVLVYTALVSYVLLKIVERLIGLRISEEEEIEGLDTVEHNERGYII